MIQECKMITVRYMTISSRPLIASVGPLLVPGRMEVRRDDDVTGVTHKEDEGHPLHQLRSISPMGHQDQRKTEASAGKPESGNATYRVIVEVWNNREG